MQEKFATAWGVELPERAGWRLDQMMSGLHDDRIKALYLIGENPAQTEPNAHHVTEGLGKLEFVVAQDLFLNDTSTRFANVVFPASSFAEKDGTFTNTERRINRVRAAVPLPGNARGDREIVITLARALGCNWPEYPDAESVWNELADLSPNWFGVRYPRIEEHGIQWPCPSHDHPGTSSCTRATRRSHPARGSSIRSSTSRRSRSRTRNIRLCCQLGERCITTTRPG